MNRFVVSTLVLLGLCAGGSISQGAPAATGAGKGPRIAVEPASFDFGKALTNKTLTKDFVLRNLGDEPLRIGDVKTSCGCTAALPADRVIPPGGHTRLSVSLQTRSSEGRLQKTVYVSSNDAEHAVLEIDLTVTVVRPGAD